MTLKALALVGLALAAGGFQAARAGVVYSSIPNLDIPENSGGLLCSTCFGDYEPLDQFTLASPETITGFKLVTGIGPAYGGDGKFTVEIYDTDHDAIVFSQHVATTPGAKTPDLLNPTHIVHGSLTGLTLPAGTYWFAAVNNHELGLPGFTSGNNSVIVTFPHTGVIDPSIQGNHVTLGFQLLSASVPENGVWIMLLFGVGGVGALARRRRQALSPS
jgi:hypothetical protein